MPCECTDVDVRTSYDAPVEITCLEHRRLGACNADFMRNAVEEIPEG